MILVLSLLIFLLTQLQGSQCSGSERSNYPAACWEMFGGVFRQVASEVRVRHRARQGGQLLVEFHFNKCWATFRNADDRAFWLMGAALKPLEQGNDLKEGLINTSYMIQNRRDVMLEWGGERTGIMWKLVRGGRKRRDGGCVESTTRCAICVFTAF